MASRPCMETRRIDNCLLLVPPTSPRHVLLTVYVVCAKPDPAWTVFNAPSGIVREHHWRTYKQLSVVCMQPVSGRLVVVAGGLPLIVCIGG